MEATQWTLQVKVNGKRGLLHFNFSTFSVIPVSSKGMVKEKPALSTSVRNVLWVSAEPGEDAAVSVATLAAKSRQHVLVHISAVSEEDESKTREWVDLLMKKTYDGVPTNRRFKVLVNPAGGKGHAKKIFDTRVKPIFEAAKSVLDVQFTTHRFHAKEIAAAMDLDIDAIVALSGDGLPHEIINGFASRTDAVAALRIPIVPVPTGSANGFNVNLHGPKEGFDVGLAVLNAIKGKPMDINVCSVTQGNTRIWSYFSQALGLMADLDLGTENLRWMGDTRFIIGYLRGIVTAKPCPIQLKIKVVKSDKQEMIKEYLDPSAETSDDQSNSLNSDSTSDSLPEDRFASESTDGSDWVRFDKPILYFYGGLQPYVALDLLQFPMARPADGLMDIVVQETASRATMLNAIDGAEHGSQFWMPSQNYYKALAFKIEPNPGSKGLIAIDGEPFPWGPLYVEVHKGLARTLSLHGHFRSTFVPIPKKTKK